MPVDSRLFFVIFCILLSGLILYGMLFAQKRQTVSQSSYLKLADEETLETRVRRLTECNDKHFGFKAEQRGAYFVLYNLVPALRTFMCHESVTYTTHGDYTFLDNIPTLVKIWKGPISVALYAPGEDFEKTLESIAYLRNCNTPLIKDFVTFHVFFIDTHFPKLDYPIVDAYKDIYDCGKKSPIIDSNLQNLYRRKQNLTYPINVGRNVAREMATTHYVFPSDIELYPSPNFIQKFMKMIYDHPEYESRKNPRVYVLPPFEIILGVPVPENKTELQEMIKKKEAFPFHKSLCAVCHTVPKYKEWLNTSESDGLKVFTVGKRMDDYKFWEAFYIGTHLDPYFDERLPWEGLGDKMSQGYSLCLLDYDYMVLDNAFLIHKPGIKYSSEQNKKFTKIISKTNYLLPNVIKPELDTLYGKREGCHL